MHVPGQPGGQAIRGVLLSLAAALAALGLAACGTEVAGSGTAGSGTAAQAAAGATRQADPAASARPSVLPAGIDPGGPMIPARGAAALCAAAATVTRLVVSPVSALPPSHVHPALPAGITVRSAARARAVAGALCALPAMPRGPIHCPPDLGTGYRLSFAARQHGFAAVTADSSGCKEVSGAGPERWTARTPAFWAVLHRALAAR